MAKQPTKRVGQKSDETAMEYLRRATAWLDYETESLLDDLPSVEAILDFFDLQADYSTDCWSGILECIAEGDSPDKARAFIRKYKMPKSWRDDVNYAMSCRHSEATA